MNERSNRWISTLKIGFKKVVATLFTRETATFLAFFVLAALLWLMHSVGSKREVLVHVPVSYTIPADIEVKEKLPSQITLTLSDEGQVLLGYLFSRTRDTVNLNLSSLNFTEQGTIAYPLDSLKMLISAGIRPTTKITTSDPATLWVRYLRLSHKTVPVLFSDSVTPAHQYVFSDSLTIEPAFVTIYGAAAQLDTIKYVRLEKLGMGEISKSIDKSVKIHAPKGVTLSDKKARVAVMVEMATEKSVMVRITPKNVPHHFLMRTFPAEAKVTFLVGMSHFNTITINDFSVEAIFDQGKSDDFCPILLTKHPERIYNVRVEPDSVEFSLENLIQDIQ